MSTKDNSNNIAIKYYDILNDKGSISRKQADKKAIAEYNEFNKKQIIESDFDKEIKKFSKK